MKRAISFTFAAFLVTASLQISAQEVAQNNVKPVTNSLETVAKLQPVSFNYDKAWAERLKISPKQQYGFVGTDAKSAVPEIVTIKAKDYTVGKNAYRSATLTKVDYESLIPLLVGSIKEQQQQIDALRQEIQSLKSRSAK